MKTFEEFVNELDPKFFEGLECKEEKGEKKLPPFMMKKKEEKGEGKKDDSKKEKKENPFLAKKKD